MRRYAVALFWREEPAGRWGGVTAEVLSVHIVEAASEDDAQRIAQHDYAKPPPWRLDDSAVMAIDDPEPLALCVAGTLVGEAERWASEAAATAARPEGA